jgi:hypothetical protein
MDEQAKQAAFYQTDIDDHASLEYKRVNGRSQHTSGGCDDHIHFCPQITEKSHGIVSDLLSRHKVKRMEMVQHSQVHLDIIPKKMALVFKVFVDTSSLRWFQQSIIKSFLCLQFQRQW